jgi:hypothetical protein
MKIVAALAAAAIIAATSADLPKWCRAIALATYGKPKLAVVFFEPSRFST